MKLSLLTLVLLSTLSFCASDVAAQQLVPDELPAIEEAKPWEAADAVEITVTFVNGFPYVKIVNQFSKDVVVTFYGPDGAVADTITVLAGETFEFSPSVTYGRVSISEKKPSIIPNQYQRPTKE